MELILIQLCFTELRFPAILPPISFEESLLIIIKLKLYCFSFMVILQTPTEPIDLNMLDGIAHHQESEGRLQRQKLI